MLNVNQHNKVKYNNRLICLGPWYLLIALKKKLNSTKGAHDNTAEVLKTDITGGSWIWIKKILKNNDKQ